MLQCIYQPLLNWRKPFFVPVLPVTETAISSRVVVLTISNLLTVHFDGNEYDRVHVVALLLCPFDICWLTDCSVRMRVPFSPFIFFLTRQECYYSLR
jgi:hypothetical protein